MNQQEIYDRVKAHLLTQNDRSSLERTTMSGHTRTECRYRSPDGLKCAVGCLIPDSLYNPDMENIGVEYVLEINNDSSRAAETRLLRHALEQTVGVITKSKVDLLDTLQQLHDVVDISSWEESLHVVATMNGLIP